MEKTETHSCFVVLSSRSTIIVIIVRILYWKKAKGGRYNGKYFFFNGVKFPNPVCYSTYYQYYSGFVPTLLMTVVAKLVHVQDVYNMYRNHKHIKRWIAPCLLSVVYFEKSTCNERRRLPLNPSVLPDVR